jgi:hypothetical protein
MCRLIPFEEIGVVDEVLDQEIFGVGGEWRGFLDLVQRGDRGTENVKHHKSNLSLFDRFEKADVAQCMQRRATLIRRGRRQRSPSRQSSTGCR